MVDMLSWLVGQNWSDAKGFSTVFNSVFRQIVVKYLRHFTHQRNW